MHMQSPDVHDQWLRDSCNTVAAKLEQHFLVHIVRLIIIAMYRIIIRLFAFFSKNVQYVSILFYSNSN